MMDQWRPLAAGRPEIRAAGWIPRFPLDSFRGAPWSRGGNALKVQAQRSTLAGRRGFERARVKNHSPPRKHSPRAVDGGAETGV